MEFDEPVAQVLGPMGADLAVGLGDEREGAEVSHEAAARLYDSSRGVRRSLVSLCFRSLRRCQHRMRELKDLGLVSSFSVGRGFGEGRAPACWFLAKQGLVEVADAQDMRISDLPWVPDSTYRSSKMIAHRLGVNAFFCALGRPQEPSRATVWPPGGPSTGFAPKRLRSSQTGSGGTFIRAERASSTSSTTGPPRRGPRSRESSRAT